MKTMLIAALLMTGSLAFASHNDEAEEALSLSCSAELIMLDGTFNPFVRLDCDSELAGQCVKQVIPASETDSAYIAVDSKECTEAAARSQQ